MTRWRKFGVRVVAFIAALLAATLYGSIVQTQLNLYQLAQIGPAIDAGQRLSATLHDLVHFAPLFAFVLASMLVIALPLAHFVAAFQKRQFTAWCIVAGGVGLYVTFQLIDSLVPPPTLIAATRTSVGSFAMIMSGCLAGFLYAHLTRSLRKINPLAASLLKGNKSHA
ncbi:MAG: hypothetical protein HLUCCO02_00200 [Idiomarinaceae bacterium HL-53]|nr:MAG: hypothetical protein HLUCCO02_00200 [Idiomarinaceae bacterium HL-53]CUS48456.1 hypothetical protein Ga0003345_1412 [Idiomarinaceae bacterium HL-53]